MNFYFTPAASILLNTSLAAKDQATEVQAEAKYKVERYYASFKFHLHCGESITFPPSKQDFLSTHCQYRYKDLLSSRIK